MKNQQEINFAEFEEIISYKFKNQKILQQALTHPSLKIERKVSDYERLEFLGDSIIGFVVSEIIYKNYATESEGSLAKRKASIVSRDSLSKIAKTINLGDFLLLSHGENSLGGRNNPANLENAFEALVAAIYLDGSIEDAKDFIYKFFAGTIKQMVAVPKDAKSTLQEWAQSKGYELPKYELASMAGPAHAPEITIKLSIEGFEPIMATSGAKKEAERLAAEKMLLQINGK
jgi:ribonuclease-3